MCESTSELGLEQQGWARLVKLGIGELQGQLGGLNVEGTDAHIRALYQVCPPLQLRMTPLCSHDRLQCWGRMSYPPMLATS